MRFMLKTINKTAELASYVRGVHPIARVEDDDHKAPDAKPLKGSHLEGGHQEHIQEDRCSSRPWHERDRPLWWWRGHVRPHCPVVDRGDCDRDGAEQCHPPTARPVDPPREGEPQGAQRQEQQEEEDMQRPVRAKLRVPVVDQGVAHQVEHQEGSDRYHLKHDLKLREERD